MKKRVMLFICLCICMIIGCTKNEALDGQIMAGANTEATDTELPETKAVIEADEGVYEIQENMFINQCNDIYLNPDDYKDKVIRIEGLYFNMEDTQEDIIRHFVIRYGPACCVNDSSAGFEIRYNGEYPELDDWIIVTGTIEKIQRNGYDFVALNVISLEVSEERGAEQVLN